MKVVGLMCVRDEADLLPEVLDHLDGNLDYIYAYDDGSQDATFNILSKHKAVRYIMRRDNDKHRHQSLHRPNYHHLLEQLKKDSKEPTWAVITMGDRFYLNKSPYEICRDAESKGFLAVEGVQLDFLRHRVDPWTEENDTFPKWDISLRQSCRWARVDEICIVAYKVQDHLSYARSKYPWPKGIVSAGKTQFSFIENDRKLSMEMPYLEHQGRRSPKAFMFRYIHTNSRPMSRKVDTSNMILDTFEGVVEAFPRFYEPYKVYPWISAERSLPKLIELKNEENWKNKQNLRYFFWGLEESYKFQPLHIREDL